MNHRNLQKESVDFVNYPIRFPLIFSPAEERFILHMVQIEKMKEMGLPVPWGRSEHIKRMQLTEYAFDKCVDKTIRLGLLTKRNNRKLNRVYYSFDTERYGKLLVILSSTNDIERLREFCRLNFIVRCRSIESITEKELRILRKHV